MHFILIIHLQMKLMMLFLQILSVCTQNKSNHTDSDTESEMHFLIECKNADAQSLGRAVDNTLQVRKKTHPILRIFCEQL